MGRAPTAGQVYGAEGCWHPPSRSLRAPLNAFMPADPSAFTQPCPGKPPHRPPIKKRHIPSRTEAGLPAGPRDVGLFLHLSTKSTLWLSYPFPSQGERYHTAARGWSPSYSSLCSPLFAFTGSSRGGQSRGCLGASAGCRAPRESCIPQGSPRARTGKGSKRKWKLLEAKEFHGQR